MEAEGLPEALIDAVMEASADLVALEVTSAVEDGDMLEVNVAAAE